MALTHAKPGAVIALRAAGAVAGEPKAQALFKGVDLEVMRLALAAGETLPPHRVGGEITVQCLSGALQLGLDDGSCTLRAGEMSYLSGGALHDVRALEDCVALVTIALAPRG
jgi:quercetin dioxygenase-like cupin family protein